MANKYMKKINLQLIKKCKLKQYFAYKIGKNLLKEMYIIIHCWWECKLIPLSGLQSTQQYVSRPFKKSSHSLYQRVPKTQWDSVYSVFRAIIYHRTSWSSLQFQSFTSQAPCWPLRNQSPDRYCLFLITRSSHFIRGLCPSDTCGRCGTCLVFMINLALFSHSSVFSSSFPRCLESYFLPPYQLILPKHQSPPPYFSLESALTSTSFGA